LSLSRDTHGGCPPANRLDRASRAPSPRSTPAAAKMPLQTLFAAVHESAFLADFVAKVLFPLAIKNSFGRRRDFRVKMWGTSSPEDKLTGALGNVIEATSIGGRRSDFFTARKLAPGNLGLLQQYLGTKRPIRDVSFHNKFRCKWTTLEQWSSSANQSSFNSCHGSTFNPFAIRAMLSIETFRSERSTTLR